MATVFSNIQGQICRTDQFGDIRLTETIYAPMASLARHIHECGCFGFVLDGEFQEDFGTRTLTCNRSSAFFRPPQISHANKVATCGARCLYVEVSSLWLDHVRIRGANLRGPAIVHDARIQQLARELYVEWKQLDDVGPLAIEGLTFCIAAHYFRDADLIARDNRPWWLSCVKEIIEARFQKTLTLSELANQVSLHPAHLAREFRKYTGTSVGEFVRMLRIEFACRQLSGTNKPLAEIALESGFSQQAHFTTVFGRLTGVTPSEYRKLMRRGLYPGNGTRPAKARTRACPVTVADGTLARIAHGKRSKD